MKLQSLTIFGLRLQSEATKARAGIGTRYLALLLPFLLAGYGDVAPATPVREIHGVMVASEDEAFLKGIEGKFKMGMAQPDVQRLFPEPRFHFFEWGRRSAIVVDTEIEYFASQLQDIAFLKLFDEFAEETWTIDFSKLKPADRARAAAMVKETFQFVNPEASLKERES